MSEFLQVAEMVLTQRGTPMSAREIVDFATENRLFSDRIAGKTPFQTMKAKLSVDIRRRGDASTFVRTGPGKFYLRARLGNEILEYTAPPYVKPPPSERVLSIPVEHFQRHITFQGIRAVRNRLPRALLTPQVCIHVDRLRAEVSNEAKQVLTYVLVTRKGNVLCYQRGNYNRVEDFLRGSSCIGFGGHVSEDDYDLLSTSDMGVVNSAKRELLEELSLPELDRKRVLAGEGLSLVGILNDDSSAVGRRHFAFVFRFEVSDDPYWNSPKKGEKSIAQLHWLTPGGPGQPIWRFEYWSQLCLRKYFPALARTVSAYRLLRPRRLHRASLICVIGTIGSGKTEAVRVLSEEFGFRELNSGRVLARLLKIRPVSHQTRAAFQKAALRFIQSKKGPERLAKALAKTIIRSSVPTVVDGLRQKATYQDLVRQANRRTAIVYVHTLPDIAYRFYAGRSRSSLTFREFLQLRDARVERDVIHFLKIADAVIYNWVGKPSYLRTVRMLFGRIGVGSGDIKRGESK